MRAVMSVDNGPRTYAGASNRHRRGSRSKGTRVTSGASGGRVMWIGSSLDHRDHCVTLDQVAASVSARLGLYDSLCGSRFVPLPMLTAPKPRCPPCHRQHQALWPTSPQPWRGVRRALQILRFGSVTDDGD